MVERNNNSNLYRSRILGLLLLIMLQLQHLVLCRGTGALQSMEWAGRRKSDRAGREDVDEEDKEEEVVDTYMRTRS